MGRRLRQRLQQGRWVEREHRYLPLDTLRAVAFGVVFFLHAVPFPFPWGRYGVDLFFVLSGYLITSGLLRSELGSGYFSRFYLRRSLRIFPAYYATIALAMIVVPVSALPMMPWSLGYLGNIGYLFGDNWNSALAHLWSLAVEEQFYLLWPLALWLVRSTAGRWRLIAAVLLIAPALRWGFTEYWSWQAAYALLPARMDGLAIGAAVALVQSTRGVEWFVARRGRLLAAAALTGMLLVVVTRKIQFQTPPHMAIVLSVSVICFGFVVAATIGIRDTKLAALMSLGPVVYLGQISYGLYLVHVWVLYALDQHTDSWPLLLTAGGGISLVLAMLSWHFFERPINDLRHRFEARTSRPAEPAVDEPVGPDGPPRPTEPAPA